MLTDLRRALAEEGGAGKAVVFSQFKSAIQHLSAVLEVPRVEPA